MHFGKFKGLLWKWKCLCIILCHSSYHVTCFMCKHSGHFCSYWARISVASLVVCCLWGLLFIWQKNNFIFSDISWTPINSVPCQESRTCISFSESSKTSSKVLEVMRSSACSVRGIVAETRHIHRDYRDLWRKRKGKATHSREEWADPCLDRLLLFFWAPYVEDSPHLLCTGLL